MSFFNRLKWQDYNAFAKLQAKYLLLRSYIQKKVFENQVIDEGVLLKIADELAELNHLMVALYNSGKIEFGYSSDKEVKAEVEKLVGEEVVEDYLGENENY